jgi:hypothetical protein
MAMNNSEAAQDNTHGDFVPLVWLIEKLRRRPEGCTMNELIAEAKLKFDGLQHIKDRTTEYNKYVPSVGNDSENIESINNIKSIVPTVKCPFCNKEIAFLDDNCKYCGAGVGN